MAEKILRIFFVFTCIAGLNKNTYSQDAVQYRVGIAYGNSLRSHADKFVFSLNNAQTLVIDSTNSVVYFSQKLNPGETYRITQLSGPRTCNINGNTGTISNQDILITIDCGFPPLTILKLNVTGVGPGETFTFKDNYGRTLSTPFSTIANLGGFPKGDYYNIIQTGGPRPVKFTFNQGTVPDNTITIQADCRKTVEAKPPPAIKYDLVSRSTDNKTTATYYETATPVIGGMSDAPGGNEGRFVAFVSYAKGIDGSSGKYRQIFWRDRTSGETKLISRSTTGEEANNSCHAPAISADGSSVAFESYATNLSANDNNGARDVFVWNQETGKVQLVSKTSSGESGNSESMQPTISGDGNVIAYTSNASNIDAASNGGVNVFVYTVQTGTSFLISKDYETGKGAGGSVPSISEDGTRIAFCSATNRLVKNDNNNLWDIFLWQKGVQDLKRISMTSGGGERDQGTESSSRVVAPAISGDGKMIAYATTATNVVPGDMNGMQDVFLYNIETGTVKRISTGNDGAEGNGDSPIEQGAKTGISYDGSWISFNTNATNLAVPKGNIIVKHSNSNEILAVTNITGGSTANPMLSRYGNYVIAGTSEKYDTRFPSSGIFTFYTNAPVHKDPGVNTAVQPTAPVSTNMQRTNDTIIRVVRPVLKTDSLTSITIKDVDFPNWDFEQGLSGWTKEGTAFNNQPTRGDNISTQRVLYQMEYNNGGVGGDYWKDQGFNQGYKNRNWIGTYENNSNGNTFLQTQGDGPTGTLTSDEVIITTNFCYFLIGGGADAQRLYVELQIKQPDGSWIRQAVKSCFRSSEQMYREKFSLQGLQNKTARIRIVDNSSGGWGHLNVDYFRFTNQVLPGITLTDPVTRTSYEVDEDAPVWGFADTHAHPANNLGFGKRLIIGKANAPLSETYSNDLCHNNHTTGGNGILNTPFIGGADVHKFMDGWPNFIDFPKFDSKTHNQQNVEFLKRAWQGGLRLFSALAVNNMYLPSLALGPGNDGSPYDDESTILQQIQEIKNMAISQSSWMEIAYTAKDARRIILQGKLAVVLGVEMDNFGNFKTASFIWNDNVNPANAKLVTLNETNADQLLEDKLNQYYNLGIRQITPMHYLSGVFGGAAVFRAELAMIQFAFNKNITVKSGLAKRIPYSLKDDYSAKMMLAGNFPINYLNNIFGVDEVGNMNALGITSIGQKLVTRSMNKGFIMDSEHMGYEMKEALFAMAAARNYPVMSSHTDPAGINFNWINQPVSFSGTPEFRMQNFGTTNIRNIATEFNLADEHYEKIKNSGGTVGVFMLPYYKKSYGNIPNDCAGSSKTWAQMYLYSADKMNGKGIALCTDRGMTDFITPRFGPNAAYTLKDEELASVKKDMRAAQRYAQRNGVRYDRPMQSFHLSWYHQPEEQGINEYENDAWAAFAADEANISAGQIPDSYYLLHLGRIRNYVTGLRAAGESVLMLPGFLTGDAPYEQAVMYCLKRNINPLNLSIYNTKYSQEDQRNFNKIYYSVKPAWDSWQSKYGNNQPLRRLKTGNRDWDFNTDGMAHYGLMPDFLQDLRNIGLAPYQLTFLFRSAEDYIQMWEKTERASKKAPINMNDNIR